MASWTQAKAPWSAAIERESPGNQGQRLGPVCPALSGDSNRVPKYRQDEIANDCCRQRRRSRTQKHLPHRKKPMSCRPGEPDAGAVNTCPAIQTAPATHIRTEGRRRYCQSSWMEKFQAASFFCSPSSKMTPAITSFKGGPIRSTIATSLMRFPSTHRPSSSAPYDSPPTFVFVCRRAPSRTSTRSGSSSGSSANASPASHRTPARHLEDLSTDTPSPSGYFASYVLMNRSNAFTSGSRYSARPDLMEHSRGLRLAPPRAVCPARSPSCAPSNAAPTLRRMPTPDALPL